MVAIWGWGLAVFPAGKPENLIDICETDQLARQ